MSELSDESRALIESEGPLDEATPGEIAAMHARVVALLAGAPAPAPSPGPDPTPLLGKAAAATSLKIVGSAIAAAVGSSALLFALSQPAEPSAVPAAPPPVVAAPQPSVAAPTPAVTPSVDLALEPAPALSAAPAAAAQPRSSKPAAPAPSVAPPSASEEALLVATAEAQLRSGHAAAALALYEQHLREYPKGALRHESQSGRIVALCGVGRSAEARAEIERFAARHPSSPSLLRMQRACGLEP
jgi:hypothetical protein